MPKELIRVGLCALAAGTMVTMMAAAACADSVPAAGTDDATLYAQAKQEGKLSIYVSSALDQVKQLTDAFSQKYPGISVEALRYVGPAQYQKFALETEAGQYIADALQLSDRPSMQSLVDKGYVAHWRIPVDARYAAAFKIGDSAYTPYVASNVIAYNTKKVTPEEVALLQSGWKSILDPRFKGRFSVTDQQCTTCYAPLFMFLDPKYSSQFGPDFVKAIAAEKPAIYTDVLVAGDRLAAGENDISFWLSEAPVYPEYQKGAPVAWVYPSPSPLVSPLWLAVSAHAPHPAAARLFQDWEMSEDGARTWQVAAAAKTVINDVPDTRPITKEPWFKPFGETYSIDYDRWSQNYNKDLTFWHNTLMNGR